MRKGKLIVLPKNILIEKEVCFDTVRKAPAQIIGVKLGSIRAVHHLTRVVYNAESDNFVDLFIQDEITEEIFPLERTQQTYVFQNENKDHVKFITQFTGTQNIAVVLAKDVVMQSAINRITPIADAYGIYVAGQKSINAPAKNFSDWYFSVSI